MHQKDLLQVLELRDGVVAVPCRLSSFFTHDALWGKDKLLEGNQDVAATSARQGRCFQVSKENGWSPAV